LFVPIEMAAFATSPFVVIVAWIVWAAAPPSAARIAAGLERLRAMPWGSFSRAGGLTSEGYAVKAIMRAAGGFRAGEGLAHHAGRLQAVEGDAHGNRAAARARGGGPRARGAGVRLRRGRRVTEQARVLAAEKKIRLVGGRAECCC
jgi:hypothetical protein